MMKIVLLVCAQALMIQSITSQCIGARLAAAPLAIGAASCAAAAPWAAAPLAYEAAAVPVSNGGGLGVSSGSAIPPNGVSILSENSIAGSLAVAGSVPFLGVVALEGALPTAGAGGVNYGCGNGAVAILAEDIAPAGIAGPFGYGALGYGVGPLAGPYGRVGCGCGALI